MKRIGLVTLCAVLALAGCSKSERPVKTAPVTPVVKPEVMKPASNAVPMMKSEKRVGGVATNRLREANLESMKAAKARSTEFALKMAGEALIAYQKQLDDVVAQMADMEKSLRTNTPSVSAAWVSLDEKQKAYDAERIKIKGMEDLFKAREAVKTRLQEMNSKGNTPDKAAVASELKAEIRRMGKAMVELELKARAENSSLKQSVDEWRSAQSDYNAVLIAVPSFGELAKKHQEFSEQYESMLSRQSDFMKERK